MTCDDEDSLDRRAVMAVWRRTLAPAPVRWMYAGMDLLNEKSAWSFAVALALLGNALQFGAFGLFLQLNQRAPSPWGIFLVSMEMLVLTGFGRFLMRRYGAQAQALPWKDVGDYRGQGAIYLRPFAHDGEIGRPVLDGFVFESMYFNAWTTESALVGAVEGVRPVFAVHDPRRQMADLGAHRVSVSADWKPAVSAMMQAAEMVIVRIPDSAAMEGTVWEVETALETVPSERLLFLFPEVGAGQPSAAWELLRSLPSFRKRFPDAEYPGARFGWIEDGRRLAFSDGWPRATVREFRNALLPFLRRFDASLGRMTMWHALFSWILSWKPMATAASLFLGVMLSVGVVQLNDLLRNVE